MSIKVVVPFSGGKDSQSCLKLAIEKYNRDEILGLFLDTKWEHPLVYKHIRNIQKDYNVEIKTISAGSVEEQILKVKKFPNSFMRFCTDRLKIRPSRDFYKSLCLEVGSFEVWMGIRSDESSARKKRYELRVDNELYDPHLINPSFPKLLGRHGVRFKFPLLNWSEQEVKQFLGDEINPLYSDGFNRVGCFPCLASTPKQHQRCFEYDAFGAKQNLKIIELERAINEKHLPANTSQLCMFCHI